AGGGVAKDRGPSPQQVDRNRPSLPPNDAPATGAAPIADEAVGEHDPGTARAGARSVQEAEGHASGEARGDPPQVEGIRRPDRGGEETPPGGPSGTLRESTGEDSD